MISDSTQMVAMISERHFFLEREKSQAAKPGWEWWGAATWQQVSVGVMRHWKTPVMGTVMFSIGFPDLENLRWRMFKELDVDNNNSLDANEIRAPRLTRFSE